MTTCCRIINPPAVDPSHVTWPSFFTSLPPSACLFSIFFLSLTLTFTFFIHSFHSSHFCLPQSWHVFLFDWVCLCLHEHISKFSYDRRSIMGSVTTQYSTVQKSWIVSHFFVLLPNRQSCNVFIVILINSSLGFLTVFSKLFFRLGHIFTHFLSSMLPLSSPNFKEWMNNGL